MVATVAIVHSEYITVFLIFYQPFGVSDASASG